MLPTKEFRKIIVIFLIVLFFHIFCIYLFIKIKNSPPCQSPLIEKFAEKKKADKPWVKLQSPPSTPVLFKTAPQLNPKAPSSSLAVDSAKQPLMQKEKHDTEHVAQATTAHLEQELMIKKSPIEITKTQSPPPPLQENKEQAVTQPVHKQPERPSSDNNPKPFSFSNLIQGFANHLQEQPADDQYTMRGKKTGKATAEQIRYAQYGSKICSTIHNAFLTNNIKSTFAANKSTNLILRIVINKDGSLSHTQILKSSDSGTIDQLVITIVKSASQSFPPIPHFFNMEQCPFVITINNALQVIEHPEQSYWTL